MTAGRSSSRDGNFDAVELSVVIAGRSYTLLAPRDHESLLTEEAFAEDEFIPYWAELWPSALALADALAGRRLDGMRVIELGCGLGLPSLVAAAAGADVLATDWAADAIRTVAGSARVNGEVVEVARYRWDAQPPGPPWRLVLAADVLYEARNVAQMLHLLPRVCARDGEVWLADPGRSFSEEFLMRANSDWELATIDHSGPEQVTIHRLTAR